MTSGITLQSQSPGAAGADIGFRLATMINGQPMAMRERELSLMVEAIAANRFTLPRNEKTRARHTEKGTAIVEVHGVLIDRYPFMGSFWGLSSYEGLAEQFRRLATNPDIKRVVLDLDTPGGLVTGIRACADELARLAEKKPVYALANNMACSAGYWIGCVAQELSVTPDGEVGSIGVRSGHMSYAEALDRDGIQVTMFTAGATKADLSPYKLLDPGAAAEEQWGIERAYDRFCEHVAKHRPLSIDAVRETDARTFTGERAVETGLADRIETLEELIARVEKGEAKVKRKPKSSETGAPSRTPERQPERPAENEPAAGSSKPRGARLMSEQTRADEANDLVAQLITRAVKDLRGKEAIDDQPKRKADNRNEPSEAEKIASAVAAAEERIFALLESDEGKARPKAALQLAKAGLAAVAAKAILAVLPEEQPAKPAGSEQQQLATALDRQMSRPGNTAAIKPEAPGAAAKKDFAALCGETASKKG